MSVAFRTHLHGVKLNSILSILSAGKKEETFIVKFNFAGFKKLIFVARNSLTKSQVGKDKLSESSELIGGKREFHFDYTTIYPHNLSSKLVTIKCYRKQLFGNTLIATASFDLLMLATGPSHQKLKLKLPTPTTTRTTTTTTTTTRNTTAASSSPLPLSSHPRTSESKSSSSTNNNSTETIGSPTIEFVCVFDQLCPRFTCVLYPPSLSSRIIESKLSGSAESNLQNLLGVPELSGVPFAKQKDGSWKFTTSSSSLTSSVLTTSQLEKFVIAWKNSADNKQSSSDLSAPFVSFSLLKNYDPKRMDLLVPLPQLQLTLSTINIARSVDSKIGNWRMKIIEGPLYHQMSPQSLANEQGVLFGHAMPHYPLPSTWAPEAQLGFLASPFHDPSTQWTEIEQLIHAHYHKLFLAALSQSSTPNVGSSSSSSNSVDEIKKQLEVSLANAKVRWGIDFSDC